MAIDTRAKRQNVASVGYPLPVSVLPSGSIAAFERAQIAWTYGGIAINPPSAGPEHEDRVSVGTLFGMQTPEPHVGGF